MSGRTFVCPSMPTDQAAAARRAGRLDYRGRPDEPLVTREWYFDQLARHCADDDKSPE